MNGNGTRELGTSPAGAEFSVVKIACATRVEAQTITEVLLDGHLIASGQIAGIESRYRWAGAVQHADEHEITCYTRTCLYQQVVDVVTRHHGYVTPQVVATAITGITDTFADWVRESTRDPAGA